MNYLIDESAQQIIAERINRAVAHVLSELPNHGSEEALTPVLGHELMKQTFEVPDLKVRFSYRQLSKYTEEPNVGADGAFLVKVTNLEATVQKAALFQAKLLKGLRPVRQLRMEADEMRRLNTQASRMLKQTNESVAMFYTRREIYVVDAEWYINVESAFRFQPLSEEHRLITLGTYLGRWLPRCTRGDRRRDFIDRVEHQDGFKEGLTMEVITQRPSVLWDQDASELRWKRR